MTTDNRTRGEAMRIWHLIKLGHSIRVNRYMTRAMLDTSKGWLFTCECGKVWAR